MAMGVVNVLFFEIPGDENFDCHCFLLSPICGLQKKSSGDLSGNAADTKAAEFSDSFGKETEARNQRESQLQVQDEAGLLNLHCMVNQPAKKLFTVEFSYQYTSILK
jgi:hypothetical protein